MTIKIKYKDGHDYIFEECDVKGFSRESLTDLANRIGKIKYGPHIVWLSVVGVGYGWRYEHNSEEL